MPDRRQLVDDLGSALAQIHRMRPGDGLDALLGVVPENTTLALVARLRSQLDQLPLAQPAIEWGLRWIERDAPHSTPATLVHRDFRTGNYLVHAGRLTAVLDWEFADWGNPFEDLGWFTARCWRFARPDRAAGGVGSLGDFLAAYGSASGTTCTEDELVYWQVLAHCRWAVIALEQAERHCTGRERSLELALTGRLLSALDVTILNCTRPTLHP